MYSKNHPWRCLGRLSPCNFLPLPYKIISCSHNSEDLARNRPGHGNSTVNYHGACKIQAACKMHCIIFPKNCTARIGNVQACFRPVCSSCVVLLRCVAFPTSNVLSRKGLSQNSCWWLQRRWFSFSKAKLLVNVESRARLSETDGSGDCFLSFQTLPPCKMNIQ